MAKNVIRSLSKSGDTILAEWDPAVEEETEKAKTTFDDLLSSGGFAMFTAVDSTTTPEQIRKFPKDAPEILAVPRYKGG